jgi:hypothetical protein
MPMRAMQRSESSVAHWPNARWGFSTRMRANVRSRTETVTSSVIARIGEASGIYTIRVEAVDTATAGALLAQRGREA